MRLHYERQDDLMYIADGRPPVVGSELDRHPGTHLHTTTEDGQDVCALTLMGVSAFLPLGPGYDPATDTLTIGETVDDPALVSESGDFVGYWEVDEQDPNESWYPVGVAIRRASEHLAPAIAALP